MSSSENFPWGLYIPYKFPPAFKLYPLPLLLVSYFKT